MGEDGMTPVTLCAAEEVHRALLEKWRGAMDLIGPGPAMPHFVDAAAAVDGLNARGQWADLGSGAGFPGIALAARWPDAQVQLVESRQKRSIFLGQVVAAAGLSNATVIRARSETLVDGSLDGVISRAYKPPHAYLQDARRLLRPGGVAVVMLGEHGVVDVAADWTLISRDRYPTGDGWRSRVVLQYSGSR